MRYKLVLLLVTDGPLGLECLRYLSPNNVEFIGALGIYETTSEILKKTTIPLFSKLTDLPDLTNIDYIVSACRLSGHALIQELRKYNKPILEYCEASNPQWDKSPIPHAIIQQQAHYRTSWIIRKDKIITVLQQQSISIKPDETAQSIIQKNIYKASQALPKLIEDIITKKTKPLLKLANYNKTPEVINSLISWQNSAEEIERMIRALAYGHFPNPYSCATFIINNIVLIPINIKLTSQKSKFPSGCITFITKKYIQISTKTVDIKIYSCRTLNNTFLNAQDLLNKLSLNLGDTLPSPSEEDYTFFYNVENEICKYDDYWASQLQALLPTRSPYFNSTDDLTSPAVKVSHHFPEEDLVKLKTFYPLYSIEEIILSIYFIYIYRLDENNDICIMLDNSNLQPTSFISPLYSTYTPLKVHFEMTDDFSSILKKVNESLNQNKIRMGFKKDVFIRHQELHDLAKDWNSNYSPLSITLVKDKNTIVTKKEAVLDFYLEEKTSHYTLIYNTRLINQIEKKAVLNKITQHLENIVTEVIKNPYSDIKTIMFLTVHERNNLLHQGDETTTLYPKNKSLVHLFEEQAKKSPQKIAVSFKDQTLTYSLLKQKSDQLAVYFDSIGVKPGAMVIVCIDRNIYTIIILLAILKINAVYVPIEINYPEERINYILGDTKSEFCITTKNKLTAFINDRPHLTLININRIKKELEKKGAKSFKYSFEKIYPCYTIYTSGSTGSPKGILLPHHTLINLISWQPVIKNKRVRVSQFASISFDVSLQEIFYALLNGFELHIVTEESKKSLNLLTDFIKNQKINIAFFPTAILTYFCKEMIKKKIITKSIKEIIVAGESLRITEDIKEFFRIHTQARLINHYGPSETHVITSYTLQKNVDLWKKFPLIGKPIQNTSIYILDKNLNLKPMGTNGELCVAGEGLANNYLNKPEVTNEKFLTFNQEGISKRIYRTGDIARILPNKNIEYIGRKDSQIKIRGFRVELSDIEHNILKYNEVKECIVIENSEKQEKYLVAFITVKGLKIVFDTKILKEYLQSTLPSYMIPSVFVIVDQLPLTHNLKVDKKALKQQEQTPSSLQPRNELEKKLVSFYAEAFNISQHSISVNEDFFNLGGNSIIAMQVIARCNQEGLPLTIKDLFSKPSIQSLADYLVKEKNLYIQPNLPLKHKNHSTVPLAPVQNRLYILAEQEPGSPFYNTPIAYQLEGHVNHQILEASLLYIIKRHDILRSYIEIKNNLPTLKFIAIGKLLPILSIEKTTKHNLTKKLAELIHTPFNLKMPPLFRFHLLLLDNDQAILFINMHHIINDGWSVDIFNQELSKIYHALLNNQKPPLADVLIQYSDFADWQTRYIAQEKIKDQLNYWKTQLKNVRPLNLPLDYPRSAKQDFQGGNLYFNLDQDLTGKLNALAKNKKSTLFNLIYTALIILLYRYTGQEDITIGTPTAGRAHSETEGLIGFFANTLVLRSQLEQSKTFIDLLLDNQNKLIDAFLNQDIPFEQVVSAVNPKRIPHINPLFQVLLGVEPQMQSYPTFDNLVVKPYPLDFQYTDFDISLYLENTTGNELSGKLQFSTCLFKPSRMERFIKHFKNLLSNITKNPEINFRDINFLSSEEQESITKYNKTEFIYDKEKHLIDVLNLTNIKLSKKIAVVTEKQSYTYEEIHKKSNLLVHYIQTFHLPENSLLAILTEKSIETIVCILAVLKTGHAYLPIDPNYPIDRINYILNDSQARLILTKKELSNSIPNSFSSEKIVFVENINNKINSSIVLSYPNPEHIAYVIYTSGSTGKPKGVMISQKSLINFIYAFKFLFSRHDYLLSLTTHSFDIFGLELFLPLSTGAKIYLATNQQAKDPTIISSLLKKEKITVMQATPTSWNMLMQSNQPIPKNLTILTGGEKLSATLAKQLLSHSHRVFNLYGPTETTIWSSFYQLKPDDADLTHIPIGKPIANTQIYILDNNHQPLPIGIPGEIYIGGSGVAQGYLNQPLLTKERFINHADNSIQRLYKTGDIGYFQEDNTICYIERNDNQIKLYGHRIELDEIDNQLLSLPNIKESVSILSKKGGGIITFYIPKPNNTVTPDEIKAFLLQKLPSYMLPTKFIFIKKVPLTSNKKVDKNALEDTYLSKISIKTENSKNLDLLEKTLHEIWSAILGVHTISLDANFFDLGGNSIRAIELIHIINNDLDLDLKISDLFQYNTISLLKDFIKSCGTKNSSENSVILLNKKGNKTPLFFFHPIGGTIFCYLPLVKHLEKNRPVYGIQDPAILSKEQLFNSIEEMATSYITLIKTIQPNGPYLLAGVSMGGTLSIEIAKQLLETTHETSYPILIDTWGMLPKKYLNKEEFRKTSLRQKEMVRNKITMNSTVDPSPWVDLNWQRLNMLLEYKTPTLDIPTLLIKAKELLPEFAEIDSPSNHLDDSIKNLKTILTPGSHETIVLEDNAKIYAPIISSYIDSLKINAAK